MARTRSQADALFQQFLPLADAIARSFFRSGSQVIEFEDARQVARMQLWLSCHKITDPVTAPAYLRATIRGAILHHFRDHGRTIRVSRRAHEAGAPWHIASLDAPTATGVPLLECITAAEVEHQPELDPQLVESLLDRLPAQQSAAIRLCILGGQSFRQAAAALGISHSSVSRLQERALATLRAQMA
ncbi:sigma-70 family RNA polymerase sigma factor [Synechococcus sp. HJ21-Hayes]|uniref:sigma-70 family RNA polymerase sigma factor n=1 Tax=Synechococcus sp. HJ21-Hayes TaxID=2823736 RepID=UPI0020CCA0C1|nr:sigma-70 family RNA polymerase sigma factor [Synechococcus sp. HJ21-Hayes]MCP9852798.1 sigma-70 family RNA polymerase sigma factor [Synechococcus sp. HJ21-Hayes]